MKYCSQEGLCCFTHNQSSVLHLAASHGFDVILETILDCFEDKKDPNFAQWINAVNNAGKSATDNAGYNANCRRVLLRHSYSSGNVGPRPRAPGPGPGPQHLRAAKS